MKKSFIQGPIPAEKIANSIAHHKHKTNIGAHDIFLGQVREDFIGDLSVISIDFEAQEELSEKTIYEIREEAFANFSLTCLHIYHSLQNVPVGELCFYVFASSPHRDAAFNATRYIVEEFKKRVPIFGKINLSDGSYVWKENKTK